MSHNLNNAVAVVGIDIGKNSFHVVGLDSRGAIVLRQKWSRGQIEARLANMPACLIGMEACVGCGLLRRTLIIRSPTGRWWAFDRLRRARRCCWRRSSNQLCKAAEVLRDGAERELILCAARAAQI